MRWVAAAMRRRRFNGDSAGRYKLLQRYADSMVAAVDDTRCVDADPIVAAGMP